MTDGVIHESEDPSREGTRGLAGMLVENRPLSLYVLHYRLLFGKERLTKYHRETIHLSGDVGRGGGDRTHDLRLKRPLLYH
jgi:hypothetical protein